MTYGELSEPTSLAPDEAFEMLGNETRIQILRTLGEAGGPLSFTELRDRVGIRQGGQFNYHLDKLVGHFVRKGEEGYELRQAGRRVIQAVLSGAVTDAPTLEPTEIDQTCPHCGAPIEVRYHRERVEMFCTACSGTWGPDEPANRGYLGRLELPPAGLQGRTTAEAVRAAWVWENLKILAIASGICWRCSARVDKRVNVCEDHDDAGGVCDQCDRRYPVQFHFGCTNCIYDGEGTFSVALAADTDLLALQTANGLNPVSTTQIGELLRVHNDYDEDVRSTDPFEAEFTFTVDGDALTLTVDDDLTVVDATRHEAATTAD